MNAGAKNIVIVGGGFAGLNTAKNLQGRLPTGWDILLFSQENHIVFTPLLGDVVGSSINPMHVVWPLRQMLRGVDCRTSNVVELDLEKREIVYEVSPTHTARLAFEHLVLATGSTINFDIIPGMAAHGWPLKTVGDALALRNHLIGLMERADVETNAELKRRLLSIVVVGGGFSGVEVAGELFDLLHSSSRYYTHIEPSELHVTVLEARERILPELSESLSEFAIQKMRKRGIDVRVEALAAAATEYGILLKDGTQIDASTVICTIGITAPPLVRKSGLPLERGRILTTPDMRVEGHDHVWALGDCAIVPNAHNNKPSPPTAQFAVRQARQLARNLARVIGGEPANAFTFKPLGMMASIGNHNAVAEVFGMKLSGLLAWLLWRGVYLSKMPTLVRKIQIAFDWLWQLFFPRDIVQLNLHPTERFGRAHFEAGQFVFRRGEPADKFYVIERGRAGVYLDDDGKPVNMLLPGNHFGEAALLGSAPRSASIRAEEPLDVLTMGRTSFQQLTGGLQVLRTALEQSYERRRSVQRFLESAKDHPRLYGIRVSEVMSKPAVTLPSSLTLSEALSRSRHAALGAYPVVDEDERMVGICTRSDFYQAVLQLRPPHTPLTEIMHRPVITVRESDTLADALVTFLSEPIKRVVVVADADAARPVGLLTPFDVLSHLAEDPAELMASMVAS
jgi:NADH dehydrogenase